MRITRADKSVLSDWWFTVDRLMLAALMLLMGAGVVLSLAASPPIAEKLGLEQFHFVRRHIGLLLPAFAIMFAVSMLTPKQIRRAPRRSSLISLKRAISPPICSIHTVCSC